MNKQNATLLQATRLAESMLAFDKLQQHSDYEHVIPKLDSAIQRVKQILDIYPWPNDNFASLFPQSIHLHYVLLEIIDISNQREVDMLTSSV